MFLRRITNSAERDDLQIQFGSNFENNFSSISIYNKLGEMLKEEELLFKNNTASIKTDELPNGVYFLRLRNSQNEELNKRFVIAR